MRDRSDCEPRGRRGGVARIGGRLGIAGVVMAGAGAIFVAATAAPMPVKPTVPPSHPARPVVLELFTSEGCSSCPPADDLLRTYAESRGDLLPLAFHVTYWNSLGWRDPYSFEAATQRQRVYAARLNTDVYTPQLVVDGSIDVVGSDQQGVMKAIVAAAFGMAPAPSVTVRRDGGDAIIEIGAGASGDAKVFLVGYDGEHSTPVGRGENAGRRLVEANIVRAFDGVGAWNGAALTLRHALPAGEHVAVIVQRADGRIIGAAREQTNAS